MNYQLKLEEILKQIEGTPKLLLHACCGPCSSYVLEYLSNYFEITILYYNPNIYPNIEYQRRLNELKEFLSKINYKNPVKLVETRYEPIEFYNSVKGLELLGEKSKRCYECYKLRLEEAAKYAKEHNFDYFTSTLSISPYKVSEWINEIGEILESKYKINYLYADFKKNNGYKRSLELSKEYNLYRQEYCGCSFSKQKREQMIKENNYIKDLITKVCWMYNLGELINVSGCQKGGITNKVYKFITTTGSYIIKILYSNKIEEIETSEEITSIAINNDVNAIGAIKCNDKYINTVENIYFLVYPYFDGKILLTRELSLDHVRKLARELSKLHSINCNVEKSRVIYPKINYLKYYELTKNSNEECYKLFNWNIDNLTKLYDKVYNSYLNLSNQISYIHRDFNRKNILWQDIDNFKIIDFETATIGNPSIDFFNSAWFLTNDIQKDKFKVFTEEYFKNMKLLDNYQIGVYAALIEECNWLEFSLKRALNIISCTNEEIQLGKDSIENSLTEILNYNKKIELILKLLKEIDNTIYEI